MVLPDSSSKYNLNSYWFKWGILIYRTHLKITIIFSDKCPEARLLPRRARTSLPPRKTFMLRRSKERARPSQLVWRSAVIDLEQLPWGRSRDTRNRLSYSSKKLHSSERVRNTLYSSLTSDFLDQCLRQGSARKWTSLSLPSLSIASTSRGLRGRCCQPAWRRQPLHPACQKSDPHASRYCSRS